MIAVDDGAIARNSIIGRFVILQWQSGPNTCNTVHVLIKSKRSSFELAKSCIYQEANGELILKSLIKHSSL